MQLKPANVILDLLRTYPNRGTSARTIMAAGELFGFSENQMRVTLSRLVQKAAIDNFQRGYYRLGDRADPVSDFVEEWRLGEARRKPWDSVSWLCVYTPDDIDPWPLNSTGFRSFDGRLWLRPDNLAIDHEGLERRLAHLGLDTEFLLASGACLSAIWQRRWLHLIDVEALAERYRHMAAELTASLGRLPVLAREEAMRESFNLGGKAIQILAKDPLLPEQFMAPTGREHLHALMCRYDKAGRAVWAGRQPDAPDVTPVSQSAIA